MAELRVHGLVALLLGNAIISACFDLRLQPLAGLALLNYASGLPIVFAAEVLPEVVDGLFRFGCLNAQHGLIAGAEHCFGSVVTMFIDIGDFLSHGFKIDSTIKGLSGDVFGNNILGEV